jgi:hypothetical protein
MPKSTPSFLVMMMLILWKSDKAITTAASLKQALVTDSPMAKGDKMLARATAGLDMARPNQASSSLADSASGANGQSLNNQAGGQAGGKQVGNAGWSGWGTGWGTGWGYDRWLAEQSEYAANA